MPARIHPMAVVDPAAEIGENVDIGPGCVIGPRVRIGPGTRLRSHVTVDGCTRVGAGCEIFPFASLGHRSQDLKFRGGCPRTEIGERTVIREYVTVHAATADGAVTRVGDDCLLMAYAHVAHDCEVGDGCILGNAGMLGGHVCLEARSILGGLTGVHQFVRIGTQAMIGACSKVTQDVPPYMLADGHPCRVWGINRVGLTRRGVPEATRRSLTRAFRLLYRKGLSRGQALEAIDRESAAVPELARLAAFVRASNRGLTG